MATADVQRPVDIANQTSIHHESTAVSAASKEKVEKHHVNAVLNFFKPNEDGTPPAPEYVNKPRTYDPPLDTHNVVIEDVTGDEAQYSLDSHGFQFVPHVSKEREFSDDSQIKDQYYKEVDQILKNATGATRTFIFDHTIRRGTIDSRASNPSAEVEANENGEEAKKNLVHSRGPVRRVHIDQSYAAALSRVPYHLPDEAEQLLKGRVQIINVWRPIKTVKRDPLAVAQSQSVVEDDLVPIGLIYDKRQGETLSVKHSDRQKWFYKYHQTPEEVLLIKCIDNKAGVGSDPTYKERAKRVPHSSFEIPGTEDEESRESIEVRVLVFHEDDTE